MTGNRHPAAGNRLPTLGPVVEAAGSTVRRFPLVLTAAGLSALAAICTAESMGPDWMQARMLAAASLGLPLFIAATLASEGESAGRRALWFAGVVIVLIGVFLAWPGLTDQKRALRYAQLSIAAHLAVAFLPVPRGRHNAFWQYNRVLFLRILVSGLTSAVTFAGLALALAALDKLFGVDVADAGYFRLWAVLAFVFNTWLFLGGLPRDIDALEETSEYPAGLRVFAQYTLLPLVSLYLVILTLYLGKVLVTWDWPSGWIGWLVSGVATAGIFTLLLVHPVAGRQKWVGVFARDFWIAIIPAIGMLWLAIWQRVQQYGMTEPRYFLLLMSIWLFGLSLFYIVTRSEKIRIIPASLCALALVTFAGPLSAYAAGERSQFGRLREILERTGVVREGQLVPGNKRLSALDHREAVAKVRYLAERGALDRLAPWLGDSLLETLGHGNTRYDANRVLAALGIANEARQQFARTFNLNVEPHQGLALEGHDLLLHVQQSYVRDSTSLRIVLAADGRALNVMRADTVLLAIPLDSALAYARVQPNAGSAHRRINSVPRERMTFRAANSRLRATIYASDLSGSVFDNTEIVTSVSGEALLSWIRR